MDLAKPIPVFRIFGIQVNLDFSWFVVFFLVSYTLAEYFYPYYYPGYSTGVYWLFGALSALLLFTSVLLHELAHSLVARHYGLPVKNIYLFIFGGVAMIEEEAPSPKVEFLIAIAGPICSFLLGSLFFLIAYFYPENDIFNGLINYLMYVNFALAFFNLIPALPLDGGRILRAIIWAKKDLLTATKVSAFTGKAFAYFLMLLGVLSLVKGNFLNAVWYFFLGWFLKNAAEVSYEQTKLSLLLSQYKVENFMQTLKPLLYSDTVMTLMTVYYPFYRVSTYPVIGNDGKIYIVSVKDASQIPQHLWNETSIMSITKPLEVYVSPYDNLYKAFKLMDRYNLDEIPVIYNNTVLGILKRSAIETILEKYFSEKKESF
ncbi:MAG: CBS domain-containing protein [Aquificae bacterium]|nr:CBS domain-containing protein [Aquificota bacterium]